MTATLHRRSLWFYVLLFLSLSTSVMGAEPEGERLHVGYSIFAGVTAPLWATKEAGLFEKNGLNVQLVYLRGGTEAAQALITGDIPFAMMGGGAVIASNLAGSGSVIVAGIENAILFKLITAKEIDSGEKLRGKKLGVASLGGSTYLATVRALQHFGMKANDATILAIGSGPNQIDGNPVGLDPRRRLSASRNSHSQEAGTQFPSRLGIFGIGIPKFGHRRWKKRRREKT